MKTKPMVLKTIMVSMCLTVTALLSLNSTALAEMGTKDGGGGAGEEIRFNEVREDILKWILNGGAKDLNFKSPLTYEQYLGTQNHPGMQKLLQKNSVVVSFVTTEQELKSKNPENKVSINGKYKTCRGFISTQNMLPHILCNIERFNQTSESYQYRLIHHEFAGLAGIEQNIGASSDYEISDQITDFLKEQTVLRLAVKNVTTTASDTLCRTQLCAIFQRIDSQFNYIILTSKADSEKLKNETAAFVSGAVSEMPEIVNAYSKFISSTEILNSMKNEGDDKRTYFAYYDNEKHEFVLLELMKPIHF